MDLNQMLHVGIIFQCLNCVKFFTLEVKVQGDQN